MKKIAYLFLSIISILLFIEVDVFAQCKPIIKVDGIQTVVNPNDAFGVTFPFWLKAGQTLAVGPSVTSISVIEFTVNNSTLSFSQVLSITSATGAGTVPNSAVWKVESVIKVNNTSQYTSAKFTVPGTYSFKVPGCAEQICIEAWGGGGGGGGCTNPGSGNIAAGGGGGGGYGAQCFAVTPGTVYTVTVGASGAGGIASANGVTGGTSSVGSGPLISVTGGSGGGLGTSSGGSGGTGGSSTATSNAPGQDGQNGNGGSAIGGAGGAGGNGGAGGALVSGQNAGNSGTAPGGGGGGASNVGNSSNRNGGAGANGQVIITW